MCTSYRERIDYNYSRIDVLIDKKNVKKCVSHSPNIYMYPHLYVTWTHCNCRRNTIPSLINYEEYRNQNCVMLIDGNSFQSINSMLYKLGCITYGK